MPLVSSVGERWEAGKPVKSWDRSQRLWVWGREEAFRGVKEGS